MRAALFQGLDRYKREIATSAGPVELVYFDNLVWDGRKLHRKAKPAPQRDFSSYAKFRGFLVDALERITVNLASAQRKFPYSMLGTLSSGYDSTAVTALLRPLGLDEVITFDVARRGDDDSGESTARQLGLRVHSIGREAWRSMEFAEVRFIASYSSAEDVVFKAAEKLLAGRVLMTGYHGDKVWDKFTKYLSDQLVRGDPSGLALCEFRLWTGFINCAVPFFGARQIRDIHALSNSAELKPWDVGGNYSRPFCRRVAEEAGIPRHAFGIRKRAVTVNPYAGWDLLHNSRHLLTPSSLADYLQWTRENRSAWIKRGKVPPLANAQLNYYVNAMHMRGVDAVNRLGRVPLLWRHIKYRPYAPRYLNRHLFPWALERAMQRYAA